MKQLQINNQFLEAAYTEFLARCQEIKNYIDFVDALDGGSNNVLHQVDNLDAVQTYTINRDLHKTLRASTYLLIYNLLESTICEAIDSVHSTLSSKNVDFLRLTDKFKNIILLNVKKGLSDKAIKDLVTSSIDIRANILTHGYEKADLLNGNLDVAVVRAISDKYDFSIRPVNNRSGVYNPETIKEIKVKRNALAHGAISFAQCGQDIPVFSLSQKFEDAQKLLLAVFNGLDNLLSQEKYLKTT